MLKVPDLRLFYKYSISLRLIHTSYLIPHTSCLIPHTSYYAMGQKPWAYQQISKYNKSEFYPVLLQAANAFKDHKYVDAGKELNKEVAKNAMTDLLYFR
ncbi:MAG: hypothetical protein ABIN89_31745 [Chitinophagaceae bacterium]